MSWVQFPRSYLTSKPEQKFYKVQIKPEQQGVQEYRLNLNNKVFKITDLTWTTRCSRVQIKPKQQGGQEFILNLNNKVFKSSD